jgi:hypothetical protein
LSSGIGVGASPFMVLIVPCVGPHVHVVPRIKVIAHKFCVLVASEWVLPGVQVQISIDGDE